MITLSYQTNLTLKNYKKFIKNIVIIKDLSLSCHNLEAIQFAWDYKNPKLRLGVLSLENECDWAQTNGYKYLYLGRDDIFNNPNNYKSKFKGYEILGTL